MTDAEWERHPMFADFVALVLEQAGELREGSLTHHTRLHTQHARVGWTYQPTLTAALEAV